MKFIPKNLIIETNVSEQHKRKAIELKNKFNIPMNDALHIIMANEVSAILVTRDAHFLEINGNVRKPEELI
ncbi:MAG: PIN domain-containing protein [Nanoarchaeota archaeon]|nr:PIN domain-containing protein [Nanoarchaeota archaeon]MBU1321692.1 PIN domain-containing protein [Nanoarchaeota archaeon]MBU1598067.1 PIN domain-containing protein [Nanoarchaeota archaeon]MBU2441641.1 PIN domain-containing protein [Nanoarchaeota archaeon]